MQCTFVDFHLRNGPEATEIDLHFLIGLPNVATGLHKMQNYLNFVKIQFIFNIIGCYSLN